MGVWLVGTVRGSPKTTPNKPAANLHQQALVLFMLSSSQCKYFPEQLIKSLVWVPSTVFSTEKGKTLAPSIIYQTEKSVIS